MSRFIAVSALILALYDTAYADKFCEDKPSPNGSRETRMRAKAVHEGICSTDWPSWWLDVEHPSDLEQFAHVTTCLRTRPNVDHDIASFIAWCIDDVPAYDENKGKAMVKQLGLERSRVGESWKHFGEWKQKAQQLQNDPQWKPIVEAATKARAAWHASVDGDHDAFVKASELAEAADGKGCTAKAAPLLAQFLAKQKPKTLDALRTALMTPLGFRLYWTMFECAGLDEDGPETFVLAYAPPKWEGGMASADDLKIDSMRGPRVSAGVAVEEALHNSSDRKLQGVHVQVGGFSQEQRHEPEWIANKGSTHYSPARGTITAMKPGQDGKILITFKTETIIRDVGTCKSTNQISRINSDGTVEYVQDCHVSGQEKLRVTPHPVLVAKEWTTGLKPGKMISYFYKGADTNPKPTDGAVSMIWTDAKRTAITGWAGMTW